MNNSCTFYIARHGQTDWNEKGLVQGHQDSLLTLLGEQQAKNLAIELYDINFDLAFSSDLLRAKRTAEIVVLEKKLAVATTQALRERGYGKYEGQPYDTLRVYDDFYEALQDEEKFTSKFEDIESDEMIITRLITFLRETAILHPGKNILVITHGDVMHKFLIKMGFGTHENFPRGAIGNTAFFKLISDGVNFEVTQTSRIVRPTPLR